MPKSLKAKFKSLRYRFLIDDAEYISMCKKLDEHDKELLDKVLERVKEHHYLLSDQINSTDYGMFTVGIEQVIAEMKAEVEE